MVSLKKVRFSAYISAAFLLWACGAMAMAQNQLAELDTVRSDIIKQGNMLPRYIKSAKSNYDIRTLERIFESNTSLLTSIESYFRMLKIVISTDREVSRETVELLNEWLVFIRKQCAYDREYLEATARDVSDKGVTEQIQTAIKNLDVLMSVIDKAVSENKGLVGSTFRRQ